MIELAAAAHEAMRQVWEGDDIPALKSIVSRVKPEDAVALPNGFAYSIATYALHTDLWNRIWLARLKGEPRPSFMKDWRVVKASEWPAVKDSLLSNYQLAMNLCSDPNFRHKMKGDSQALSTALNIAVHTSYHVGQIAAIKRALRTKK